MFSLKKYVAFLRIKMMSRNPEPDLKKEQNQVHMWRGPAADGQPGNGEHACICSIIQAWITVDRLNRLLVIGNNGP